MTTDEAIAEVRYMIPTANITSRQAEALATLVYEVERLRAELARVTTDREYWREWGLEARRAERARTEGHSTPVKVVIGRHDIVTTQPHGEGRG